MQAPRSSKLDIKRSDINTFPYDCKAARSAETFSRKEKARKRWLPAGNLPFLRFPHKLWTLLLHHRERNKNWYKPDSCLFVQRSCCTPPGDWRLVAARRSLSFSLSLDTPTVTIVLRNLLLILNMNSIRILLWCICLFFFISTGKLFVKLLHVSPSNAIYMEPLLVFFVYSCSNPLPRL